MARGADAQPKGAAAQPAEEHILVIDLACKDSADSKTSQQKVCKSSCTLPEWVFRTDVGADAEGVDAF